MQILNSLDGLTGKGVGAVVVTANPENAKQLAEMLTQSGTRAQAGTTAVQVNAYGDEATHMIFAEKTADYALYLRHAEEQGMTIIDLGDNSL